MLHTVVTHDNGQVVFDHWSTNVDWVRQLIERPSMGLFRKFAPGPTIVITLDGVKGENNG